MENPRPRIWHKMCPNTAVRKSYSLLSQKGHTSLVHKHVQDTIPQALCHDCSRHLTMLKLEQLGAKLEAAGVDTELQDRPWKSWVAWANKEPIISISTTMLSWQSAEALLWLWLGHNHWHWACFSQLSHSCLDVHLIMNYAWRIIGDVQWLLLPGRISQQFGKEYCLDAQVNARESLVKMLKD